jgi:hypothetical protein
MGIVSVWSRTLRKWAVWRRTQQLIIGRAIQGFGGALLIPGKQPLDGAQSMCVDPMGRNFASIGAKRSPGFCRSVTFALTLSQNQLEAGND